MKIAILTFVKQSSFGATLQCYSLSRILQKMGHEIEIIDFLLPKNSNTLVGRIADKVSRYLFSKFEKHYLPPFTGHFTTGAELFNDPPEADCYIVGSDQVWNPDITKDAATTFFLDFVPAGKRRISYAASFGVESWKPIDKDKQISDSLSKFDAIGLREDSGLNILKNQFGLNGKVVLDPTLLLDDYRELVSSPSEERAELVSFRLVNDDRYLAYLAPISRQLGLIPVLLNRRRYTPGFKYRPFIGIKGWLNSIATASFVVTDSFHCMVFSILFRKNFVVIPSHPERTTRMTGLLSRLGLGERFFSDISMVDINLLKPISYNDVFKRLEEERSKSMEFLINAING